MSDSSERSSTAVVTTTDDRRAIIAGRPAVRAAFGVGGMTALNRSYTDWRAQYRFNVDPAATDRMIAASIPPEIGVGPAQLTGSQT